LWARVRDFLADLKSNGDKRERRGGDRANKVKLTEAFAAYDPAGKGALAKKDVAAAFTRAGLSPALTDAEWDKLVGALDAWEQREARTIVYRRILEATYAREPASVHGIFPRVRAREPSKYETERKAKAEEEERKALEAAEVERVRRDQAHTKMLAGQALAGSGFAKGPSKEDLRRSQKEEQLRREAEKKEADRLQQLEDEAVKREVGQLRSVVASIQAKARRAGEDVRKWFSLFDADGNCRLDQQELSNVLQHAGVRLGARELPRVFRLLDTSGDGRLAYTEFCDVVEQRTVPDYKAFVKAERAR
jgi:Ca2+-binding EF-hand superfamily protein